MIDMVDLFNTNATAQLVTDFLNDVDEMVSSLLEGDFLQNLRHIDFGIRHCRSFCR